MTTAGVREKILREVYSRRRMIIGGVIGATLGYVFYITIGCSSGACPITSNPWLTTAYGAWAGWILVTPGKSRKPITKSPEELP